jgi:hypothetical protein
MDGSDLSERVGCEANNGLGLFPKFFVGEIEVRWTGGQMVAPGLGGAGRVGKDLTFLGAVEPGEGGETVAGLKSGGGFCNGHAFEVDGTLGCIGGSDETAGGIAREKGDLGLGWELLGKGEPGADELTGGDFIRCEGDGNGGLPVPGKNMGEVIGIFFPGLQCVFYGIEEADIETVFPGGRFVESLAQLGLTQDEVADGGADKSFFAVDDEAVKMSVFDGLFKFVGLEVGNPALKGFEEGFSAEGIIDTGSPDFFDLESEGPLKFLGEGSGLIEMLLEFSSGLSKLTSVPKSSGFENDRIIEWDFGTMDWESLDQSSREDQGKPKRPSWGDCHHAAPTTSFRAASRRRIWGPSSLLYSTSVR